LDQGPVVLFGDDHRALAAFFLGCDHACVPHVSIITVGRKSKLSLCRPDIATMESGESIYNQDDATGFIKLNALRLRVKAMVEKQAKKKA